MGLQERAGQKSEISGYGSFLCRAQPECRLLRRRKEESRNSSADDVKAKPCDETDSGLDVDAVRLVSKGVEEYQKDRDGALLIITHSTRILESLHVDYTHVMVNGHIVATGDGSLVDRINEEGYESFVSEAEEVKEP